MTVTAPSFEQVPPHNIEAEESVIGAMMLSSDAIAEALELLGEEDFYRPTHRTVWRALLVLHQGGEPIDAVSVSERLRRDGVLQDIGGAPFLFTLVSGVPTAANVGYYARIVAEAGTLRRLIDVGTRIVQLGFETPQDTERAVGLARSLVEEIGTRDTKKEETSAPPPAVDQAMFRGILGEIVEQADPGTEADPVAVYGSLVAGAGAIIGPGPYARVGNTRHPLLVWPLLFGHTGTGRKGEGTETAELFLLSSYSPHLVTPGTVTDFGKVWADLRISGLSSGEGLIERIRDPNPDDEKDEGGTDDKRLLVVEGEFSTVMARAKREGSTLAGVLREAWAGKALGVLNRKALKASSSHVAIIAHVTPREFRLRLADQELAGGTYNRFLPLWVEQSKLLPIPEGIDDIVRDKLGRQLADAVADAVKVGRVQLDREATVLWTDEVYPELIATDDEDQAWTQFTRRAAPYCLRVAAISAVLDGRSLISMRDLDAAAALVRYSVASARYVLGQQPRDPRLDRIRRAIDGAGPNGRSRTEISGLFSGNLTAAVLDALLAELLTGGRYERFDVATGGRPATRYRRRP